MILADTSVWIDHLHARAEALQELLDGGEVVMHPFVLGELALGTLRPRDQVMELLTELPQTDIADPDEVLRLIDAHRIAGSGLSYVDVHLLASLKLATGARLWTRDKRLHALAERMGLAYVPSGGSVQEAPAAAYDPS